MAVPGRMLRLMQSTPLWLNSDFTAEAGAPQHLLSKDAHHMTGRTALSPDVGEREEKFSGLLKISACFRNQVWHLQTKPPVSFMEDRVCSLSGTDLGQASSGVNLAWTKGGKRPESLVGLPPSTNTYYNIPWSSQPFLNVIVFPLSILP